jgi:uncharacterized protein
MAASVHAPGTFCWFECGSKHAARAKAFYPAVFGWQAVDVPMPGGGGNYTVLKAGGEDIAGLFPLEGPRCEGIPSHWATYVAVEDVSATLQRATALGGKPTTEVMAVPGVGQVAKLQDPTGAVICIGRMDQHPGTSPQGPFGWSELATRDTARAEAFYTALFGWKAKPDPKHSYTEFQAGGKSIAGMMAMTPQHGDAPPHWLPYVMVEDCDRTIAKAAEMGATLLVPPTDIENVGRFSVFLDPAGAALAAIKLSHL